MAECEICGKKADRKAKIDGNLFYVCKSCAELGKEVIRSKKDKGREIELPEKNEQLIDNYHKKIRERREELNLTREELGKKLGEKSSVIKRMERNEMKPSLKLLKKIEKYLGISLIEKRSLERKVQEKNEEKLTIGDIAKIEG